MITIKIRIPIDGGPSTALKDKSRIWTQEYGIRTVETRFRIPMLSLRTQETRDQISAHKKIALCGHTFHEKKGSKKDNLTHPPSMGLGLTYYLFMVWCVTVLSNGGNRHEG